MKKILFITTRNPYSGRFSGDVIGSLKIINFLKEKNQVDVVTLYRKKTELKKGIIYFKSPNYFLKIFYVLHSLLRLKPLQFGLFLSKKMKAYVKKMPNDMTYYSFIILDPVNIFQKNLMEKQ